MTNNPRLLQVSSLCSFWFLSDPTNIVWSSKNVSALGKEFYFPVGGYSQEAVIGETVEV